MVSGFKIIAEELKTFTNTGRIVFSGASGTYVSVADDSGDAVFTTPTAHPLKVGDVIQIDGTVYENIFAATVTAVPTSTTFTAGITFINTDVGAFLINEFITFDDFVPPDFMQEIQVEFGTSAATKLSVTLDGGANYVLLKNDETITGLATFTFFVKKDSVVNFVVGSAVSITMVIGAS